MQEIFRCINLNPDRSHHVVNDYIVKINEISDVDKQGLDLYINNALKELLDFVFTGNTYYKESLLEIGYSPNREFSAKTFERLAFTTKEMIQKKHDLLLSVPLEKIAQVHSSTGTTGGKNIYMMYTMSDLYGSEVKPEFGFLFDLKKEDIVTIALPYEMSSSGQSFHRVVQIGYGAVVLPTGKGGAYSEPVKTVQFMKDLICNVLITTPSYAIELIKAAKQCGIDIQKDIKLKMIYLTGEGCSNSFRERIERKWSTTARFYYGSLECGALGIECEHKKGYHIPPLRVYVEIINPKTGEVLEDGKTGEIVVTTLLREGMPLIRYRTQDLGYLKTEKCKCGINLKKLHLRGRKMDQIHIGCKQIAPLYFEEQLMQIKEVGENYRLNVYKDYVEIIMELNEGVNYYDGIERLISEKIREKTGIHNKVTIKSDFEYDGKKLKRVNYMEV